MQLNYLAILLATVGQFIFGALWYTLLFGPLWGKMHGFNKLSKAAQQELMSHMGPFYGVQFLVTLVTSAVLALFIAVLPADWNPYGLAGFFWLGFMVPTIVSGVIFGGTEGKWIVKKIAVQAGAAFFCVQIAAAIISSLG